MTATHNENRRTVNTNATRQIEPVPECIAKTPELFHDIHSWHVFFLSSAGKLGV
jgi:hypothetical protein